MIVPQSSMDLNRQLLSPHAIHHTHVQHAPQPIHMPLSKECTTHSHACAFLAAPQSQDLNTGNSRHHHHLSMLCSGAAWLNAYAGTRCRQGAPQTQLPPMAAATDAKQAGAGPRLLLLPLLPHQLWERCRWLLHQR
jgi:hypothetical protein